jgi:hypothetical protein
MLFSLDNVADEDRRGRSRRDRITERRPESRRYLPGVATTGRIGASFTLS